jgi:hypothetical protein
MNSVSTKQERSMRAFSLWLIYFISVPHIFAHDGTDELRDFKNNKQKIFVLQKKIKDIKTTQDRLESLNSQLILLQRNVLFLRNKIVEESPKIKSSMSKYDLDYMSEAEFILKKANRTLKDIGKVLHE